jgi:two-component system OmpR family response regulator
MAHIFLLEDDSTFNDTIVAFLEDEGYNVVSAYDGYEAEEILYEQKFDLLLLDVNVPMMNGFELLKKLRENEITTPAIYITSLNSIDNLEEGFNSGCDDYIRKPFDLKELQFRVETILKRNFFHNNSDELVINENISYFTSSNRLSIGGKDVTIHNKESRLLKLFLQNKERILSHDEIFSSIWDFEETPSDNALRTYIKNLRKLIGKDRIQSVKKLGYIFK